MQQERNSVVLISQDDKTVGRYKQACEFLLFEIAIQKTLQDFSQDDKCRPRTLIIDWGENIADQEEVLMRIRQALPKLQVLLLVNDLSVAASIIKVSGFKKAYVVQKEKFEKSFLMEFFLFQRVYCEFLEIQASDLFPDTVVFFNAYQYLPLNRKYFPVVHEDFILSEKKFKRIETIRSLYIDRRNAASYSQYIEKYFDQFNVGLRKRAKARAYQLISSWRDALFKATLSTSTVSSFFEEEADFAIWLNELLSYIKSAPDPWTLIFEVSQMGALRFENSFSEMLIASYFSRYFGKNEVERIINLKGLLVVARVSIDPLLYKKWLIRFGADLSPEEKTRVNEALLAFQETALFKEAAESARKDYQLYCAQFVTKQDTSFQEASIVHTYWGELMAYIFSKAPADDFKKQELLEEVMVRCKSDAILNEAWIEELRQFLLKEPATQA